MNFGDPSAFGTEMADRFVASGANLPPPVSNRVNNWTNEAERLLASQMKESADVNTRPSEWHITSFILPTLLYFSNWNFGIEHYRHMEF